MTPDEVSQLKALQQQVAFLNRKLQAAEMRADKKAQQVERLKNAVAKEKAAVAKEKAAVARERADKEAARNRVKELEAALVMTKACAPEILDITGQCLEMLFGPDAQADIPQAQKDRLHAVLLEHRAEFENLAQFRSFFRLFRKGSESLRKRTGKHDKAALNKAVEASLPAQINAALENKVTPIVRDIESRTQALSRMLATNGQAVLEESAQEGADEKLLACAEIAAVSRPPEPESSEPRQLQGRQLVAGLQQLQAPDAVPPGKCPHCSDGGDVVTGAEQVRKLRRISQLIEKLIGFGCSVEQYSYCRSCGKAFVTMPKDDVPCSPQNSLSQQMVVSFGVFNTTGVSLNKLTEHMISEADQLGKVTLGRNVHAWALSYGIPMTDQLRKKLADKPVLMMDETPVVVLQSRGQGVCEVSDEQRQTDYLVVQTAPSDSDEQRVILFRYIGSRKKEAITAALADLAPEVIVSDGYAPYASYCKTHETVLHQGCLVHLRRLILDALSIKDMEKTFFPEKKYGEQQRRQAVELMRERHKDGAIALQFCSVIEAFSKIYAYEKTAQRISAENREEHLQKILECRQKYATPLMKSVDTIMASLSEQLCVSKADGTVYEALDQNSLFAKAVTYYMNRRESFRVFLTDARVPPDNNAAERAIRPATVLRKAIGFKQSQNYTDSMCTWLSLVETAKANGVRNIVSWLSEYGHALYKYRMEAVLNERIKHILTDGQGNEQQRIEDALNKRVMTAEFNTVSLDAFPFDDWLPWNYLKQKNKTADAALGTDVSAQGNSTP